MSSFFIGVDPSLENTAVCVLSPTGDLVGAHQSKLLHLKSSNPYERLLNMRAWMEDICAQHRNSDFGYENYSYGSTNKAYKLGELGGVLKSSIFLLANSISLVPPSSLKLFATGNGAAGKDLMIAQALKECPKLESETQITSDICDAYFLAKAALFINDTAAAVASGTELLRHRLETIKKGKYEQHRRV